MITIFIKICGNFDISILDNSVNIYGEAQSYGKLGQNEVGLEHIWDYIKKFKK
jgi:hypothetical protein